MNKIPEDAVCFCCKEKAWGYITSSYNNENTRELMYICVPDV